MACTVQCWVVWHMGGLLTQIRLVAQGQADHGVARVNQSYRKVSR